MRHGLFCGRQGRMETKPFFDVHSQFPCVTRTSQLTVTVAPASSLPPPLPAQETQASLVRPSARPIWHRTRSCLRLRRRRRVPTSSRAPLLPSLPHFPSLTLASSDLASTKKYLAPQQNLDPKVGLNFYHVQRLAFLTSVAIRTP